MFIIFGYRRIVKMLAMLQYVCGNCGQDAAHRVYTRWLFFTLFFLPVLPLGRKQHRSQCIACGAQRELTKHEAQIIIGGVSAQEPVAAA